MSERRLQRECRVFTRHLIGTAPGEYVAERYLDAHRVRTDFTPRSRFDRFLCSFAAVTPLAARLADAWCAMFAPGSVLRRKLVLLLAMLESCAPHYRRLEDVSGNRALAFAGLFGRGLVAALVLLVSVLVFLPARIALGPAGGGK
jgi:hypothetical protein